MHPTSKPTLLHRYFTGLAEHAFQTQLGVVDPPLIDYIADLLVRFVHRDSLYRVRNVEGKRLVEVADMLAEAEQRVGDAKREGYRHIGDYTLFWTGLYPEAVQRLRKAGCKDQFIDYMQFGKRSYHLAASIPTEEDETENDVLERLSARFELCAYGLGELRREWQNSAPEDGIIIN